MGLSMIRELAESFPQLYLAPGEEGAQLYPDVVLRGKLPENRELIHFHGSDMDNWRMVETPAGEVRVVTLGDRSDFIAFLQIMGSRCNPEPIPPTQGAVLIDGLINRGKIDQHKVDFYQAAKEEGRQEPDLFEWIEEYNRFTADKRNYTESMIVLSVGPYSGTPVEAVNEVLKNTGLESDKDSLQGKAEGLHAQRAGMSPEDWLGFSQTIRLYHECAHFVCRRLFPDKIHAVKDELVADAVGIYAAFGCFIRELSELFLGIRDGRYIGGRLENYTDDPNALLPMIDEVLSCLEAAAKKQESLPPLEFAVYLEEAVLS